MAKLLQLQVLCGLLASALGGVNPITSGVQEQTIITSRTELNAAIEAGPNRKMGFLSDANYRSVHTVLSSNVEPVIFTSTTDLYEAVDNGTVLAALISGQPDATMFTAFSTELISPRSFQMMPGTDSRHLLEAVDAAVVRSHNAADILRAVEQNPPFQAIEVHTCRSDDPSKVPFPDAGTATGLLADVLTNKRLRLLSYGLPDAKPDWHQDGNYQVDPPTGFWPDYMVSWMGHFREAYGSDIILERVWMTAGGTDNVLNGTIHMTEPYYIYENLYNDRVKKWSHEFSCIVMGYEQQFFAKAPTVRVVTDGPDSADSECAQKLETCAKRRLSSQVSTRLQLNAAIEAGTNKKMGFLSEANYKTVHTVLSSQVEPVIYTSTDDLYKAVEDGTVLGALMSGQPDAKFIAFSTDLISPRAFQMMPGSTSRDLLEAVDAAVVRSHNAADIRRAEERNPPFKAVEVHTCRSDDVSKVPFPDSGTATGLLADVLANKRLRILSYGLPDDKPDWHQDGNYQVDPPTGFWPDYMDSWMGHFRAAYGNDIELERVWMKAGGTLNVLNGTIHMTEPYYIYENLYNDRLKKWSHAFSCIVMGYEQQFFAMKAKTDWSSGGDTCELQVAACEQRVVETNGAHHSLISSALLLTGLLPLLFA